MFQSFNVSLSFCLTFFICIFFLSPFLSFFSFTLRESVLALNKSAESQEPYYIFSLLGFLCFYTTSMIVSFPYLLFIFLALLSLLLLLLSFTLLLSPSTFSPFTFISSSLSLLVFISILLICLFVSFLNVLFLPLHLNIFFAHLLSFICFNLTQYLIFVFDTFSLEMYSIPFLLLMILLLHVYLLPALF